MVGITNKKNLAFAAVVARASAMDCSGTPQPFLCDDGWGHETTSIITVYPSGCPGYTDWNDWHPSTTWGNVGPDPTNWDYWYDTNGKPICHNGKYKDGSSCTETWGPAPTTWDPVPTDWSYWYDTNGKPICHNGKYKDGSSCTDTWSPVPTDWSYWYDVNGKPICHNGKYKDGSSCTDTWAPVPTDWDYWYDVNGKPICHNGKYKDGSSCTETWAPVPTDWSYWYDVNGKPICHNGKYKDGSSCTETWAPVPTDWSYWYDVNGKPICHNGKYKDGSSCTETWAPVPTDWSYWYDVNGKPICHNGKYKDGSACDDEDWTKWTYDQYGNKVVIVTLTETYTIPCSTGWEAKTSVWYTTHCGCTETPVPEHPAYTTYTTECPESWGVGKTVTVTIPLATWTPPAPTWVPANVVAASTWVAANVAAASTWVPVDVSSKAAPVCPEYCGSDNKDKSGKDCVYSDFVVAYKKYEADCEAAKVVVYFYGEDHELKPKAPAYCSEDNKTMDNKDCNCDEYTAAYKKYEDECAKVNVTPYKYGYDEQGKPVPPPVCNASGKDMNGKACDYSKYQVAYTAYQSVCAEVSTWAAAAIKTPAAAASTWAAAAVKTPAAASETWSTWAAASVKATDTWSTWANAAVKTPAASATGPWSEVKAFTGAASSTTVSHVMVVIAGIVGGAAILL